MSIFAIVSNLFQRHDVSGRSGTLPSVSQTVRAEFQRSIAEHNAACKEHESGHDQMMVALHELRLSRHQVEACVKLCGSGCPFTKCPLHAHAERQTQKYSGACPALLAHTEEMKKKAGVTSIGHPPEAVVYG